MDRMIYLSMAGAKAAMQRQDVLANNLANVSTNGFRAELAAFRAVPVRGDGASTRAYALETTIGYNPDPGALDVNAEGLLVQRNGLQVMGDGGPITVPPDSELTIGSDGTISAKGPTDRPTTIGRLKMVTPEGPLTRGTDGLFRAADGELPADPAARLQD